MSVNACWAKKSDKNGKLMWLPLDIHLSDTMNTMGYLWEHWLSDGQKEVIARGIKGTLDDAARLARFLGGVHDIGKATPAFQIKKSWSGSTDLDFVLISKLEKAGFTSISTKKLTSIRESHHTEAGQYLLHTLGVQADISHIISAHHGMAQDLANGFLRQESYGANLYQEEYTESIRKRWEETQRQILNTALEANEYSSVSDLPSVKPDAAILLTGLLIMADWIASNEKYFPLLDLDTNTADLQERFEQGMQLWIRSDRWIPSEFITLDSVEFERRFLFSPNSFQEKVMETLAGVEDLGIMIIEAPMGVGKTEAALFAVEQIAAKKGISGLFFGLPTQATSDGIFDRIVRWLKSLSEENKISESIRPVHGKAALNETFQKIARNIDPDSETGGVFVNAWFSGRKTAILDDFTVGTVDQFLMAALKQKHLFLRHLGLSKKAIIIDEVHAYDAYMSQYLYRAVEWFGAYNVPVIILSATLPRERREKLVTSYLSGKQRKALVLPNISQTRSYPLITFTDGDTVHMDDGFPSQKGKSVRILRINELSLINTVKELYDKGGVVGVMVNTVRRAQEIADACAHFASENVLLLHSAFIATDRVKKERELLSMIGKNGKRPERFIVVGTQVIEQSLDIDFDIIISDPAPMDLLLQRMGRLHRNESLRRTVHTTPTFYVIGEKEGYEFDSGSVAVYGGYLLMRTKYYLPEEINLPNNISALVQQVYGEDGEDLFFDSGDSEKYDFYKNESEKKIIKKESDAKIYRLDVPFRKLNPFEARQSGGVQTIAGWLANTHPNDTDSFGLQQVRDTDTRIEVIPVQMLERGYAFLDSDEDLSYRIDDPYIAKELAKRTLGLPHALTARYNIEETIKELEDLNIRYFANWQRQPWLKGMLGLPLRNNRITLGEYTLIYSDWTGLQYRKEEAESGKI